MLSSLWRQVRSRKFKALYTSSVATIQQPLLPDTPLSCAFDVFPRFTPPSATACGWGNNYIHPAPHSLKYSHGFTNANQNIANIGITQQLDTFVYFDKRTAARGVLARMHRTRMTTQKQTNPDSRLENAGKCQRNIRSLALIPPFKALDNVPGTCTGHDRRITYKDKERQEKKRKEKESTVCQVSATIIMWLL